jgi:uncharacterized membrane protein YkvA (DUF1232 family)
MNGKRKVNITHLQKLSTSLDIELTTLMDAAGFITKPKEEDKEIRDAVHSIQNLIQVTQQNEREFTETKVKKEIINYQKYSQSEEGRKIIIQEFQDKLDKTDGMGPYITQLKAMFSRFSAMKSTGTAKEMALMGAALLYFIVTTDLIPDYLVPIGLLDDALIMQTINQHLESKKLSQI